MTALVDVIDEMVRQDAKWGKQNHHDGTGPRTFPVIRTGYAFEMAAVFTHETDSAARRGEVTWRHIFLKEVFEALAENNPSRLRAELVQVAAVAVQWADAISRRSDVQVVTE